MNENENSHGNTGGGLLSLLILVVAGWLLYSLGQWAYNRYFIDYDEPWWTGTSVQQVCNVHIPPEFGYCEMLPVTVDDHEITTLDLPDGTSTAISTMDCDISEFEEGLAGKDNRYCVIGEIGGGREWQVNER